MGVCGGCSTIYLAKGMLFQPCPNQLSINYIYRYSFQISSIFRLKKIYQANTKRAIKLLRVEYI